MHSPLRGEQPEVVLDLGAVFRTAYDRAAYEASVDYRKPPQPPLEAPMRSGPGDCFAAAASKRVEEGQLRPLFDQSNLVALLVVLHAIHEGADQQQAATAYPLQRCRVRRVGQLRRIEARPSRRAP